ncbi:MAG: hypothetical protein JXR25_11875 [Pontiellaceae bacterium]|nr:hypothetical protein [Pontiellaceae bacterium]
MTAKKKAAEKKTDEGAKRAPVKRRVAKKSPAIKKAPSRKNSPSVKKAPVKRSDSGKSGTLPKGSLPLNLLESSTLVKRLGSGIAKVGRPRAWGDDPDKFIREVNSWIHHRKTRMEWEFKSKMAGMVKVPAPKPLTIASLCNWLGITVRTFERYCSDEEHPLWGICQQVRTAIEADLWDSTAPSAKLNLQSNFGHRLRADITTNDKELPKAAPLSIDPSKLSTEELTALMSAIGKASVDGTDE